MSAHGAEGRSLEAWQAGRFGRGATGQVPVDAALTLTLIAQASGRFRDLETHVDTINERTRVWLAQTGAERRALIAHIETLSGELKDAQVLVADLEEQLSGARHVIVTAKARALHRGRSGLAAVDFCLRLIEALKPVLGANELAHLDRDQLLDMFELDDVGAEAQG